MCRLRLRKHYAGALRRLGWKSEERDLIEYTPVPAFDFIDLARQYLQAYHDLPDRSATTVFDWPRYAMLLHAVEIALKSYLISRGMTLARVKLTGHDLKRLMRHATANGLVLTDSTVKHIKQMSKPHLDNLPRYPNYVGGLSGGVVDVKEWVPAAEEVVAKVHALVKPTITVAAELRDKERATEG